MFFASSSAFIWCLSRWPLRMTKRPSPWRNSERPISTTIERRPRHPIIDRRCNNDFVSGFFKVRRSRRRVSFSRKGIHSERQMRAVFFNNADRQNNQRLSGLGKASNFRERNFCKFKHRTPRNSGWSNGVSDWWSDGSETQYSSTPVLHHSTTPIPFSYRNISRNFLLQLSSSSLLGNLIT